MSKTTGANSPFGGKLSNLIERPKNLKSFCSLSVENVTLPCIEEGRRGSRRETPVECKRERSEESYGDGSFWLRPGLSLPKMRDGGRRQRRKSHQERATRSSSTASSGSSKVGSLSKSPTPSVESGASVEGFAGGRFRSDGVSVEGVGPSRCPSAFEVDNSGMITHSMNFDDPPPEESKALKNWTRWMKIRQRQTERIAETLKRDKCQLVMNTAEDTRQVNEERSLLTYARIDPPDKWRGSPQFWKDPVKLPQRGMKDDYCAYTTLSERGIVPPMEFVSVPDAVKVEKGVYCDRERRTGWQRMEYRKEQRRRYAEQLREMQPHEVDGRELVVIGERIAPEEESESPVQYDLPVIEVTPPDDTPTEVEFALGYVRESVATLVINGVEVTYTEDNAGYPDSRHTWSLIFQESPIGVITEQALHVENKGTVAVRYQWVREEPKATLAGLPERRTSTAGPNFFFDKNPGIFLPGQKSDIRFYHRSRNPGYHRETWCLKLNPNLFGRENGRVTLTAVAESDKSLEDFRRIDRYIDSCVRDSIVREILAEVLERSERVVPPDIEYPSLFMEEELFEFQNPAHYYRYSAVEELKSLYQEVQVDPPEEWDLNLFTLEDAIRERATGKTQRTMLCRLMDLTRSLLRPGPECYKFNDKHKMVYNVLCGAVDDMERKVLRIRENFFGVEEGGDESSSSEVGLEETTTAAVPPPPELMASARSVASGGTSAGGLEVYPVKNASFFCRSDDPFYRFALQTVFFHCLGEAVEMVAGIVQTCKLFEHHGEVVTPQSTRLLEEELW